MKIQNIPNKRNGSSSPIQPQSYYKIDLADSRNRSPHRIAKKKAKDILLSFDTSISPKELDNNESCYTRQAQERVFKDMNE